VYAFEKAESASQFAKKILPLVKKSKLKLILEPGRFISGNSGIMVTRVLYRKNTGSKRFIIVDGGMNDLIRPSLYSAYHTIIPVIKSAQKGAKRAQYDVVGPICETGDFLAKARTLPSLRSGDLLAVMGSGAYGYTMSSNYNSRPRVTEVMVDQGRSFVVKRRETYKDLVRGESARV
jgi:diaminopimelate decarboxylase